MIVRFVWKWGMPPNSQLDRAMMTNEQFLRYNSKHLGQTTLSLPPMCQLIYSSTMDDLGWNVELGLYQYPSVRFPKSD